MAMTKGAGWAPPARRRWSADEGRRMGQAFRRGRETVAEFAQRHGLAEARVRRWLDRLGDEGAAAPAAFVPVRVIASGATRAPAGPIEIGVEGVTVRVSPGFDAELLRDVIVALRPPC